MTLLHDLKIAQKRVSRHHCQWHAGLGATQGRASCPDSAAMCKHVAATLYGIGARLDVEPELLFGLRKVDAKELIAHAGEGAAPVQKQPDAGRILDSSKLADVFGIDFGGVDATPSHRPTAKKAKSVAPRKAKSANHVGKRSARGKSGKAR